MVPGPVNAVTITPPPAAVPGAAAPRRPGMIRGYEHRRPPARRWHSAGEARCLPHWSRNYRRRRRLTRKKDGKKTGSFTLPPFRAAATRHDQELVVNRPGEGGTYRRSRLSGVRPVLRMSVRRRAWLPSGSRSGSKTVTWAADDDTGCPGPAGGDVRQPRGSRLVAQPACLRTWQQTTDRRPS